MGNLFAKNFGMTRITDSISAKFANMSFVCACLVAMMHLQYDRSMCGGWVFQMLFHGLPRAAVPFFFLASGFFLSGKLANGTGGMYVNLRSEPDLCLCRTCCGV